MGCTFFQDRFHHKDAKTQRCRISRGDGERRLAPNRRRQAVLDDHAPALTVIIIIGIFDESSLLEIEAVADA